MQRNRHRNKLDRRNGRLYMVIVPESELRKRSVANLLYIYRKANSLIGRIRGSGLTRGSQFNENDQTVSAYREYVRTIRKIYFEKVGPVAA